MSFSPGSLATMWSERTTHTLVPSWRRVYTSRAIWIAIFGSAACRLPQCLWSRPLLLRTKTSQRGHSCLLSIMWFPWKRTPVRRVRKGFAEFAKGEEALEFFLGSLLRLLRGLCALCVRESAFEFQAASCSRSCFAAYASA